LSLKKSRSGKIFNHIVNSWNTSYLVTDKIYTLFNFSCNLIHAIQRFSPNSIVSILYIVMYCGKPFIWHFNLDVWVMLQVGYFYLPWSFGAIKYLFLMGYVIPSFDCADFSRLPLIDIIHIHIIYRICFLFEVGYD
jgi:hypothetical protein